MSTNTKTKVAREAPPNDGKTYHYKPKPAVSVVTPKKKKDQTTEDAPEKVAYRKVTKTDYSRGGGNKVATPKVEVSLIAAELLGKAYTLLIEAEKLGITPDCIDVLNKIFLKTTALVANVGAS
jgi:hypothetical protein